MNEGSPVLSQADTLSKYLLNELSAYESTHADALSPLCKEANQWFMGDHLQVTPGGTTSELRMATSSLNRAIDTLNLVATQLRERSTSIHVSASPPLASTPYIVSDALHRLQTAGAIIPEAAA